MKKYTEKRPWGKFERFCLNEKCAVKILTINPNEELSWQYHKKRAEFWRVLEGPAKIVIGEKIKTGKKDDEFFVPIGAKHQIKAGKLSVKILEISFGEFDENDVVRLKDKYKRKHSPIPLRRTTKRA